MGTPGLTGFPHSLRTSVVTRTYALALTLAVKCALLDTSLVTVIGLSTSLLVGFTLAGLAQRESQRHFLADKNLSTLKSYLIKAFLILAILTILVLLILSPIPWFFPTFFLSTSIVGAAIFAFISNLPYRL